MSEFEIFKEITIGGREKATLLGQLALSGIKFNEYANTLFAHNAFSPSHPAEQVSLVRLRLSDLHLDGPSSFLEITTRALDRGLKLCPLYLAAFLRLEYLDQPEGPYLTVASPLPESDENFPTGFYIRNLVLTAICSMAFQTSQILL